MLMVRNMGCGKNVSTISNIALYLRVIMLMVRSGEYGDIGITIYSIP
jgi:hypothetical protein